jgi:3-keto-disaccharide hydrolase
MMRFAVVPVVILGATALASGALLAQGPGNIQPLAIEDRTGFEPIFDGTSLAGWEGDVAFWRAEGGLLIGETTAEKPLPANTFLIWTKGQPADFEIKLDFRISAGNTGLQYRSQRAPDVGPYVLKGYQADIDFANMWTGQLYEERGRTFMALPGQATFITGDKPRVFGSVTPADALKAAINVGGWNTLHVIARKELVVHAINGKVSAVFLDGDTAHRPTSGFLGLQLHMGPPMKAEFRNIALRTIQ